MTKRRGAPQKNKRPIINQRIKEARKNTYIDGKPLTQSGLADILSVTTRTIQYWEHGHSEPNDEMLHEIAEKCHVSVAWLKGEDVQTIFEKSKEILENFNPEKYVDIAPILAAEAQAWAEEWYPIVIAVLEHCGYSVVEIRNKCDFYKLSMFMESEIKHSIETYMNIYNDNEKEKER